MKAARNLRRFTVSRTFVVTLIAGVVGGIVSVAVPASRKGLNIRFSATAAQPPWVHSYWRR